MSARRDHDVVSPDGMYVPASYSHGMWAGDTLYVAGQVARAVTEERWTFCPACRASDRRRTVHVSTCLTHHTHHWGC